MRGRETLCKYISKLITSSWITNLKIFAKLLLTHKMVIHLHMLGVSMEDGIRGNGKSRDIVTLEFESKREKNAKIFQHLVNPTQLRGSGGQSMILKLCGGARNNVLFLSTPSDGIEAKIHQKTSS